MARVKFKASTIEDATCPKGKGQAFIWDSDTPGLGLRVTASGAKAFVFQSRFNGGDIRMTIGEPRIGNRGTWPLNNQMDRVGRGAQLVHLGAREKARQYQTLIDEGRDPRLVKADTEAADVARRGAERAHEVRVREAWTAYLADRKPHWGERHYKDHEDLAHAGGDPRKRSKDKTIPGPLAVLMSERLRDMTPERLEAWAAVEAATRPARARLGLRIVKAFIKWCATKAEYRESVQADAASSKRIREKLGNPTKRQTVLQREQLRAWFDAVRAIPNPVIAAYLQFMLLNGPRPNEPLALRWDDLHFGDGPTIRIRDKIEGLRLIGMTPYTASLLNGLPRRNEWVFSSPLSKSGALVEPGDAHDRACDAAKLPRITLQGLRRSFATLSEWVECPAGIAAQVQGHAPAGVREQNYVRRPVDLLRMWHCKIEEWILREAGLSVPAAGSGP